MSSGSVEWYRYLRTTLNALSSFSWCVWKYVVFLEVFNDGAICIRGFAGKLNNVSQAFGKVLVLFYCFCDSLYHLVVIQYPLYEYGWGFIFNLHFWVHCSILWRWCWRCDVALSGLWWVQ